jgi:hypothetical protein
VLKAPDEGQWEGDGSSRNHGGSDEEMAGRRGDGRETRRWQGDEEMAGRRGDGRETREVGR